MLDETRSHAAKSTRSARTRNDEKRQLRKMQLIKRNIMRDEEMIQEQVDQDRENIDLDKIKKTFKNVINDGRFLRNYEKIKSGNPELKNAKERKIFEKREKRIEIAKHLFAQ